MKLTRLLSLGWLVVGAGCGTATTASDAASAIDGGGDAASIDSGVVPTDADVDAAPRADAGSACAQIDMLDRHCATDADCASAIHAADCCGTYAAIGFAASEASAYATLEPLCDASYPACGCAARSTMTDSGETVASPSDVHVACVTRGPGAVCLTYVNMRPPNGR